MCLAKKGLPTIHLGEYLEWHDPPNGFIKPDDELIEKFSEIATRHYKVVKSLTEANEVLERARDVLLPRLISGKLSVENLDIQFPPSMEEAAHAA